MKSDFYRIKTMVTRILLLFITAFFTISLNGQCPSIVNNPLDETTIVCANDFIDLSLWSNTIETDVVSSNFTPQWTVLESNLVLADGIVENLPLVDFIDDNVCAVQTFTFQLDLICIDNGESLSAGALTIDIAPIPQAGIDYIEPPQQGISCSPQIEDICPDADLTITYSYDSGSTYVDIPPTNLIPGTTIILFYKVFFPNIQENVGTISCGTTGVIEITCPDTCPTTVLVPVAEPPVTIDQCEEIPINLNAFTNSVQTDANEVAVFAWRDNEGNLVDDPENAIAAVENVCAAQNYTFSLEVDCISDSQIDLAAGSLTLQVFPTIEESMFTLPESCNTEIIANCPDGNDLMIEYSTDGINYSTTPPPPPMFDTTLEIFYRINLENAGACDGLEDSFIATCPSVDEDCPTTVTTPVNQFLDVCGNVGINLTPIGEMIETDADDFAVFIWRNEAGQEISSEAASFEHTGDNCLVDIQIITVEVSCTEDPSVSIPAGTFTITLYPDIEEEDIVTLSSNCMPEITTVCGPDLIIEYSIDGGSTYTDIPPPSPELGDPPLFLDYRIYWEDFANNNNCLFDGQLTVFCADCPDVSLNPNNPPLPTYCNNGPTLDLMSLQFDQDPTIGEWAITESPTGNNPAQIIGTVFNPDGADPGEYTVAFFNPLIECPDTSFQIVEVAASPSAGTGSNESLCLGEAELIFLNDYLTGDFEDGEWQETSEIPSTGFDPIGGSFNPSNQTIGLYQFQYSVGDFCGADTAFVEISILESQEGLTLPSVTTCNGELGETIVNFNALLLNDTITGTWTSTDNLPIDLSNLAVVNFNNIPEGEYSFSFATEDSCPSTTIVIVQDCSVNILLPTAFSPNNDGLHDEFKLLDPSQLQNQNISFQIYNRWGELVFNTSDPNIGWDGTFKDDPQPIGVYIFYVVLQEMVVASGNLTLVR